MNVNSNFQDQLIARAEQIMAQDGYQFSQLAGLSEMIDSSTVPQLLQCVAEDISEETSAEKKPFLDQNYLYSKGDFNLSLVFCNGLGEPSDSHEVCANEFDLLLVNLGNQSIDIPVLQTKVDINHIYEMPVPAKNSPTVILGPYHAHIFKAYNSVPLLDGIKQQACLLTAHSEARGPLTWTYNRETFQPTRLIATQVADSRSQLAASLIGELSGSSKSIECLEGVAKSDRYAPFVRWEAFSSLCKLDEERGRSLLEAALVHDGDQYIRQLADKTLMALSVSA
ncbi:HEAT repeat domain-containing protein [Endozoicomonas arenosclerae]|uniref:HEAT repeat domain-containing protein n=1 Tax=Endozoicomonas arenosclerae TaxID=1633495 RepID=UPI000784DA38|nr:HEAT repeat domain-containing protein [Endozoicomonas arenosclerae]